MMATFAANLRRLMAEQGLSLWRLSVLAGVSEMSIVYWRREMTLDEIGGRRNDRVR